MHRLGGNFLIGLAGLVLLGSAAAKFAGVSQVVSQIEAFGFQGEVTLLAIGEAGSALLLLFPSTRAIGVLLVSSYLGGAIATHMQHTQSPFAPAALLGVVWVGVWLRHPAAARLDREPAA